MPEGLNTEIAHHLSEKDEEHGEAGQPTRVEIMEIAEAILLAIVAIVTAWSGYQAAKWDGQNALHYGEASKYRTTATKLATLGGQQRLYDIMTFNSWLQAESSGNKTAANLFLRRFTPGYKAVFDLWLKTHPFHNPRAPAGPIFMPQYHNTQLEQSAAVEAQAAATFEKGTQARETGDEYVRDTVFLASILFLVALSQRFKVARVRQVLLGVSFVLLIVAVYTLTTLPVA